ncbi:NAD-dependent epimerase/dehydratase family protein [Paraburkholderia phosphatilytica]|uniref:NAD-dependent epimerase/dehydratase family protein n=1 Tax=Paraburkholderia phosphatilytica TaxID=2282883 RepID=UPI000E4C4CCA|nr:NAD(P)-dependent oxidoreductase [Paraburkholderia phosphatilytica]
MHDIPHGYSLFRDDLEHVCRELAPVWSELRGAHLFLTGATGFFGIWLIESVLWANDAHRLGLTVTALSRAPEHFLDARAPHLRDHDALRFVEGDVTGFEMPAQPCTHILHAASESNVDQRADWAERQLRTSIDGTRRVIEMAVRHQSKSILLTSSGSVYLPSEGSDGTRYAEGPNGLADYASERTVYGQTKRMMEIMTAAAAQQHGFHARIARCFAFVGPYLPLEHNYAIGNFIRDALHGRTIVVGGDGAPLRSYLYAADLVVWLLTIMSRGRSGAPYNVGGNEAVSIRELAQRVAKAAGAPADAVVVKGTPVPGAAPSAYLPSLARVEAELGVRAAIPLDDAIHRTLAWHVARGERSMTEAQAFAPCVRRARANP